jgi:hypothetical protein
MIFMMLLDSKLFRAATKMYFSQGGLIFQGTKNQSGKKIYQINTKLRYGHNIHQNGHKNTKLP